MKLVVSSQIKCGEFGFQQMHTCGEVKNERHGTSCSELRFDVLGEKPKLFTSRFIVTHSLIHYICTFTKPKLSRVNLCFGENFYIFNYDPNASKLHFRTPCRPLSIQFSLFSMTMRIRNCNTIGCFSLEKMRIQNKPRIDDRIEYFLFLHDFGLLFHQVVTRVHMNMKINLNRSTKKCIRLLTISLSNIFLRFEDKFLFLEKKIKKHANSQSR